jgi:hypothetical protein
MLLILIRLTLKITLKIGLEAAFWGQNWCSKPIETENEVKFDSGSRLEKNKTIFS